MMDCGWSNPGADPYTGTPSAAIARIPGIPAAVRMVLIARVARHDFDDVVMIDRESIRSSKHTYMPDLRFMAFGSSGKVCERVTRAAWSDEQVEGAWVYCESGWCIAMPAVCRNWSIVTRLGADPTPEPAGPNLDVAPQGPAEPPPGISEPAPSASAAGPTFAQASSERWLSFGTPGIVDGPQAWMPAGSRAPIAPVPEPSIMVLLALGIAGLIAWRRS